MLRKSARNTLLSVSLRLTDWLTDHREHAKNQYIMEKTIYYHDTDAGGVVYYANYLKYLEEARTEFFAEKGISILELHNEGFMYAVRRCDLTYKAPARYGTTIICDAQLEKITAAQIFFTQTVKDKTSNQTLVEAKVVLVSLNTEFKAIPVPDNIRNRLEN